MKQQLLMAAISSDYFNHYSFDSADGYSSIDFKYGNILNAGFDQVYNMLNESVRDGKYSRIHMYTN